MAKKKLGFIYYNTDTDRYQDIKIKRLKKAFGCQGMAVYDYVLCEIYRVKGCFLEWDEHTAFDVSDYFDIKENALTEIINYCCYVGLFNKELFASEKVLSSSAIQSRYLDMCKRAKRKNYNIPEKLIILPEESAKVQEESAKVPEQCRQSKVKYSRVEESKEEESTKGPSKISVKEYFYQQLDTSSKEKITQVEDWWQSFFDKYESNGWMIAGSPITQWHSAANKFIRNCEANQKPNDEQMLEIETLG